MNYGALKGTYWAEQATRVERLRQRIVTRSEAAPGTVIPDDEDLVIGTGRRLNATVIFLDISNFSQRPSATAQEQELMLRVLNLFFTEMVRVVEDYGGHVEKNTGDGLMAYFTNDQGSGTGSTQRAVACAITMDAINKQLISPIMCATGLDPIHYRTSMDTGVVTIARIGAPRRFNANVAIGNVANFAANMLRFIGPGDISLGANAQMSLPEDWKQWTERSAVATGWTHGDSPKPYPIYLYGGRWARLV